MTLGFMTVFAKLFELNALFPYPLHPYVPCSGEGMYFVCSPFPCPPATFLIKLSAGKLKHSIHSN